MNDNLHDAEKLLLRLSNGEREVIELVAQNKTLDEISKALDATPQKIRSLMRSARLMMGANDDLIDDYLQLLENWERNTGSDLFFRDETIADAGKGDYHVLREEAQTGGWQAPGTDHRQQKRAMIDRVERDWSAEEMRDLAASLLRLADSLDQDWSGDDQPLTYRWPSSAARIERNAVELSKRAVLLLKQRRMRDKFLPAHLFGEPAWNMLLELFCQFAGGAKISTKSLSLIADCPATTALRNIERLEKAGLIRRSDAPGDKRLTLYELTHDGVVGVGSFLSKLTI